MLKIKQLFCKHQYKFIKNLYGDAIIAYESRSIWKCIKCGKNDYRLELHDDKDKEVPILKIKADIDVNRK